MFVVNYMKSGIKSVASKLTRKEEKGLKWLICRDTDCVLPTQTKPNQTKLGIIVRVTNSFD